MYFTCTIGDSKNKKRNTLTKIENRLQKAKKVRLSLNRLILTWVKIFCLMYKTAQTFIIVNKLQFKVNFICLRVVFRVPE